MRLKCFAALCCVTILAVGWFIPLLGCTVRTQEPVDKTVEDAAERKVNGIYAKYLPYVSIRDTARRQWCKDRGLAGSSSMYQVELIGSTVGVSEAAVEWCDTTITAGLFGSR